MNTSALLALTDRMDRQATLDRRDFGDFVANRIESFSSELRALVAPPVDGGESYHDPFAPDGGGESDNTPPQVEGDAVATPGAAPDIGWRCFHCEEAFTDRESAAIHFGAHERNQPACTIDAAKFREMELLVERYQEEDGPIHRQMHRQASEHVQALRRAEETGYAKALKDTNYTEVTPGDAEAVYQYRFRRKGEKHWVVWQEAKSEAGARKYADMYEEDGFDSEFRILYTRPAPPVVDESAALTEFTEYFVRNYPGPNTIISDPKWHAPKIFRAAKRAIAAALGKGER